MPINRAYGAAAVRNVLQTLNGHAINALSSIFACQQQHPVNLLDSFQSIPDKAVSR
jgi:hypothetical protein